MKRIVDGKMSDDWKLTRRASDFAKPVRSAMLHAAGCSSCCCLFWPCAVIGATAGMVICLKKSAASHLRDVSRANLATLFIVLSFSLGMPLLVIAALYYSSGWPADAPPIAFLAVPMVLIPHVVVVPAGLMAIAVAILKKLSESNEVIDSSGVNDEPLNGASEPRFDGVEFACKLTWVSFWLGTLGMSVGVVAMVLLFG
jgi:hypothetical protein